MAEARDYERSDVSVRGTVLAIAIGSLVLAILGATLWQLTRELADRAEAPPAAAAPDLAAASRHPALQRNPQADLRRLEARARARLEAGGWVDRRAGLAHIPISRAMEILADRGWPEGEP